MSFLLNFFVILQKASIMWMKGVSFFKSHAWFISIDNYYVPYCVNCVYIYYEVNFDVLELHIYNIINKEST